MLKIQIHILMKFLHRNWILLSNIIPPEEALKTKLNYLFEMIFYFLVCNKKKDARKDLEILSSSSFSHQHTCNLII